MPENTVDRSNGLTFLVRFYWLMVGNALLLFFLAFLVEKPPPVPYLFDILYWLVAASVVFARYVDIRFLGGKTDDDRPATMVDFKRHALIQTVIVIVAWVVAHAVKRYM
ncbi:MAG: hypothetical protein C0404_02790 [Verrucomicrobia bacterium]|nr:hypothetical protein [Verrucomicrobiota bacterium]